MTPPPGGATGALKDRQRPLPGGTIDDVLFASA